MKTTPPYWAPRVSQAVIRRLYEEDAKGIYDEEVINEAGYALYARCKSIVIATKAENGEVTCPSCGQAMPKANADDLHCPCGWQGSRARYKKSYRKRKLFAGDALPLFETFLKEFERAADLKEKTLAIDRLIHTFHHELLVCPTSPAAKNLIEGNIAEIVGFLDGLTYGAKSTPELVETRERYKRTLARSWAGGATFPKNWRQPYAGQEAPGDGAVPGREAPRPTTPPGSPLRTKARSQWASAPPFAMVATALRAIGFVFAATCASGCGNPLPPRFECDVHAKRRPDRAAEPLSVPARGLAAREG